MKKSALPDDPGSVPTPTVGGTQFPDTPAPREADALLWPLVLGCMANTKTQQTNR